MRDNSLAPVNVASSVNLPAPENRTVQDSADSDSTLSTHSVGLCSGEALTTDRTENLLRENPDFSFFKETPES